MKHIILSALLAPVLISTIAAPAAVQDRVWRPTVETEILDEGPFGTLSLTTYIGYDRQGREAYRLEDNEGLIDSLVYRYNDLGRIEYRADYRGYDRQNLNFYTYDEWEYDPLIPDLAVLRLGHQNVDQEWTLYAAEKTAISRDADGQITRIADYTPGDPDAGIPDLPISYVKTLTNTDGRLTEFLHQSYQLDPVTEEAYLRTEQHWTDIEWEEYAGQVLDPNTCLQGPNRLRSATVDDGYYGYTYRLDVSYTPALTAGHYDYEAIIDAPTASLRKLHTLKFTDANGSFEETFRTYRIEADGTATLTTVERVTENYDERGNIILQETALTADRDNPEHLSTRMGKKWEYTYDATYNDWTRRREFQFYQNYADEGPDGTYENTSSIVRSDWVELTIDTPDAITPVAAPAAPASLRAYTLTGQPAPAAAPRGLRIEGGRKVLR